jgi:hypothetical protein
MKHKEDLIEYDNTSKLVDKEVNDLTRLVQLVDKNITILDVENTPHNGTTYFVLSHNSMDHIDAIEDRLLLRNAKIYSVGYKKHAFNMVKILPRDVRESTHVPSDIIVSKDTVFIKRSPLISFRRPLTFTLCLKIGVMVVILYLLWLIGRIVT